MATPGKLEVTIKISALPEATTTPPNGWKSFVLDCDGQRITVTVRPKLWTKLEEAAKWSQWVAAITGKMGPQTPEGFTLLEPAIQAFERKPKPEGGTSAPSGEAAPTAGP